MTLTDLSATKLLAMLHAREVTAAEVMQACLDCIAQENPPLNAIVALKDTDALMEAAAQADKDGPSGALWGLPMAVKDTANAVGFPGTLGSPILAKFIPKRDDLHVARMRAAGAIFIGKTNVPEFGLGSHSVNPVYGATRNPYDTGRSVGGSSGGAAASLASRMQWAVDGSDMMGSLRNPAGWANVYGFRPSFGLVPADPDRDLYLHPLATSGPMARSPEDLALLLDVQAGRDPRVPSSYDDGPFATQLDADLKGRRVAWLGDWGGAWPMDDGVIATCEAALNTFDMLGCTVESLPAPFPAEDLWQSWIDLRSFAVAGSLGPLYDNPDYRPLIREDAIWEIERGRALSAQQIMRASSIRSNWFRKASELFQTYDALIAPTAQVWPFPVDWAHPKQIAGQQMDTYHRWMECVIPCSLIGLPGVAVPAGFGDNGLPMGLQFIGPHRGDLGVLQLAQGWHQATGWPDKRPPQGAAG
ncbi:amidase [Pseudooceanicola sp. MF1-13]|uniref:amidase n=1 Tax=Pseudooceanicola sp. MF1-13 TaxID=3379095 RepID=UPI003892A5C5